MYYASAPDFTFTGVYLGEDGANSSRSHVQITVSVPNTLVERLNDA